MNQPEGPHGAGKQDEMASGLIVVGGRNQNAIDELSLNELKERLAECSSWQEARILLVAVRDGGILVDSEFRRLSRWASALYTFRSDHPSAI